jgi:broad specificity phosphatase PhoE
MWRYHGNDGGGCQVSRQELYLVRHGQSVSNVEHRLCGVPPGPGLTELGRLQAEAAATTLLSEVRQPIHVVSSPLLRAWQTADALARKLGRAPTIEVELRETGFGPWEGRTVEELKHLPAYHSWQRDPENGAPRGVERVSRAGARALAALTALAQASPDTTLIAYSHQHVLLGFVRLCGLDACERSFSNAAAVHAIRQGGSWRILSIDRRAAGGDVLLPETAAVRA